MQDKILRSIGFPIKMLRIIDTYAYKQGLSRSGLVVQVMSEFIKKHKLEKTCRTRGIK